VDALERAIPLDSAAEPLGRQTCRLCDDFMQLADVYFWWDSLPAAERTAQRFLRIRPTSHQPWELFTATAARTGDVTSALANFRRLNAISPVPPDAVYGLRLGSALELYDEVERDALADGSPRTDDVTEARWVLSIALRNEGGAEALRRHVLRSVRHVNGCSPWRGCRLRGGGAVAGDGDREPHCDIRADASHRYVGMGSGAAARHHAWRVLGMALAASGDTQDC
jgi:hypothetical protein